MIGLCHAQIWRNSVHLPFKTRDSLGSLGTINRAENICRIINISAMHCPILLKFWHAGALVRGAGIVIENNNDWRVERPQVAMQH